MTSGIRNWMEQKAHKTCCIITKIIEKDNNMLGGIIGDIVGSIYEFHNIKTKD